MHRLRSLVSLAPDTFDIQPDGLAFVKAQPSGEAQLAACQEALESCPWRP
jgi:ferredoxin